MKQIMKYDFKTLTWLECLNDRTVAAKSWGQSFIFCCGADQNRRFLEEWGSVVHTEMTSKAR